MSYDLYLLELVDGEDPSETIERLTEEEEEPAPDASILARNRRIADALVAANPGLEEFKFDHEHIAEVHDISVEEARTSYRHIELTHEDGLQISLFDHQAAITFPYWDSLDPDRLLSQIATAAEVVSSETGWQLYDPQLEKVLDPTADAGEFRGMFDVGREHVRRIATEHEPTAEPPKQPSFFKRLFNRS